MTSLWGRSKAFSKLGQEKCLAAERDREEECGVGCRLEGEEPLVRELFAEKHRASFAIKTFSTEVFSPSLFEFP